MQKLQIITCCNNETISRVYYIGDNLFLVMTECPVCGRTIAELRSKNSSGEIITNTRRSGEAAEKLYKKYESTALTYIYKTHVGTKAREYEFINKFGIIYNGNGIRIAEHNKFLQMSKSEIISILNSRFYKKAKIS